MSLHNLANHFINLRNSLQVKAAKISSSDEAYKIGVNILPAEIKSILSTSEPSLNWAFEGSVGRGTWSRTPWVAVYDQRVTSRASDGFYVAFIMSENKKHLFLTLMNSSAKHINFTPFRLNIDQVDVVESFQKGNIPRFELSESGRGTGPDFETSTLLWKKYQISSEFLSTLEDDFLILARYYKQLVEQLTPILPKEKPFKTNPFILK